MKTAKIHLGYSNQVSDLSEHLKQSPDCIKALMNHAEQMITIYDHIHLIAEVIDIYKDKLDDVQVVADKEEIKIEGPDEVIDHLIVEDLVTDQPNNGAKHVRRHCLRSK